MKIVIITYYYDARFGYQEPNLARSLAALGHEVVVITSNKRTSRRYKDVLARFDLDRTVIPGMYKENGVITFRLKCLLEVKNRIWLRNLEKTLLQIKPDVIHMNGITRFSSIRISIIKRLKLINSRLVFEEHMVYSVVRKDFLGVMFYKIYKYLLKNIILKTVDSFVAVTKETVVFMENECGIPSAIIELIPLGVDHRVFQFNALSRSKLRKKYGVNDHDVLFIYAGKFLPDKGPHLLIEAGIRLCGKYDNIRLLFVGNGDNEYVQKMKSLVDDSELQGHVIWEDFVENEQLFEFYSAADVGVWPLQESMTMLEAASCSLPIIVRNSLSIEDRIGNNNGFGYDGSVENLSHYMQMLMVNKRLRTQMGRNGRQLIKENMNWDKIAEIYTRLYAKSRLEGGVQFMDS